MSFNDSPPLYWPKSSLCIFSNDWFFYSPIKNKINEYNLQLEFCIYFSIYSSPIFQAVIGCYPFLSLRAFALCRNAAVSLLLAWRKHRFLMAGPSQNPFRAGGCRNSKILHSILSLFSGFEFCFVLSWLQNWWIQRFSHWTKEPLWSSSSSASDIIFKLMSKSISSASESGAVNALKCSLQLQVFLQELFWIAGTPGCIPVRHHGRCGLLRIVSCGSSPGFFPWAVTAGFCLF